MQTGRSPISKFGKSTYDDHFMNKQTEEILEQITPEPRVEARRGIRKKSKNKGKRMKRRNLDVMPTIPETNDCHIERGESGGPYGDAGPANQREQQVGECGGPDGDAVPTERKQRTVCQIRTLVEYVPERISSVQQKGWEEVSLVVDSGASETVIGTDMIQSAELRTGNLKKRGVEYEVADGTRISNEGEKKFRGITEENAQVDITAQVCDINKGLLSVRRMVDLGQRVVFEKAGGYIEDCRTGKKMWMTEDRGLYMLKMWIKPRIVGVFRGRAAEDRQTRFAHKTE